MSAKGLLRSLARSVFGDGMLERARAMSLGLLGATAALGLAVLALVFNQGWPLVAGGPLPPLPPRHQDVARARVAVPSPDREKDEKVSEAPGSSAGPESSAFPATADPVGDPAPQAASELVVVPSSPVEQTGDAPRGVGHQSPAGKPQPEPAANAAPAEPAPAAAPAPAPVSPPQPQPESPPATASEAPPESSLPEGSHGKGHAYGRSNRESED